MSSNNGVSLSTTQLNTESSTDEHLHSAADDTFNAVTDHLQKLGNPLSESSGETGVTAETGAKAETTRSRSPSYHTSVLKSSNFSVNDANINVSAENIQYIEKLYQQLKNINRGLKVNKNNISMVIIRGVEIVNTWKHIDIEERDDVAIQALLTLVKNTDLPEEELEYLGLTIKTTISMIFKSLSGEVVKKKNRSDIKKQKKTLKNLKQNDNERVSTGQILENIIDKLDSMIQKEKYQPNDLVINLAVIVGMVINFVEKYNYLSGMEKKEIVVQSIITVITEKLPTMVTIDDKTQRLLNVAMDGLPQTVDLLVAVSNGKFELKIENVHSCIFAALKMFQIGCSNNNNNQTAE